MTGEWVMSVVQIDTWEEKWMCSLLSHVELIATLWIVACQAPLCMDFSRQEYWSGLPCPPPGDLPDPGIKSTSLMSCALAGMFFTTGAIWEAQYRPYLCSICPFPSQSSHNWEPKLPLQSLEFIIWFYSVLISRPEKFVTSSHMEFRRWLAR